MSEQYYYKGKPCTVGSRSVDGLWFAKYADGLVFQGLAVDFVERIDNVVQMPLPDAHPYIPTTNEVPRKEIPVSAASQPAMSPADLSAHADGKVSINSCTPTALNKAMKGIGRRFAQDVLARKPETGYQNWEQVLELNADLPVNWEEIQKDSQHAIAFL